MSWQLCSKRMCSQAFLKECMPNMPQQPCYVSKCVPETKWELLGGFESNIFLFTYEEMPNKYIEEKHCLSMISTVQWRGALICHLVPSTVLFSTNNGVLFLLPFTRETSGNSWGRGCCLYPSQPDRFQPLLPLGRGLKNMEKQVFFTSVCPCGTTHLYLFFLSVGSFTWTYGKHFTGATILFVTVTNLI